MGRRVWAIVRALSGRTQGEPSLTISHPSIFLYLPLSFSLFLYLSIFLFPLCLSSSLSLRLFLFSILHLEPAWSLHYFIIFKHVTFLARLRSLSPSSPSLLLSLSPSLWAWRCATLQKNMLEIATGLDPALLGVINVDGWTSSPAEGDLSLGSQSRRVRIFFHA